MTMDPWFTSKEWNENLGRDEERSAEFFGKHKGTDWREVMPQWMIDEVAYIHGPDRIVNAWMDDDGFITYVIVSRNRRDATRISRHPNAQNRLGL